VNLVTRTIQAGDVRIGDRLVQEDRRPLVLFSRTQRSETTIQLAATIKVPARTPIQVQRRTRLENLDAPEPGMPRYAEPRRRV